MAEKLEKPQDVLRPQLLKVEAALDDLWMRVSPEEKMTNQTLEKKIGVLRRILHCIKDSNGVGRRN